MSLRTSIQRQRMTARKGGILPTGYQQVEYIESTGVQYINTLLHISCETSVEYIAKTNTIGGSNIFTGTYDTAGNQTSWSCTNGGATIRRDGQESLGVSTTNKIHIYSDRKTYIADGVARAISAGNYFEQSVSPLMIFQPSRGGVVLMVSSGWRLYEYHLKDEVNHHELNLIPCYRKSDSKPGLYDIVNGEFFVNQGTGADFILGPEV